MATTLSTTTLAALVGPLDSAVLLASVTDVLPGMRLYVDRELMGVLSLGLGTSVNVLRGVDGTATTAHSSSQAVTLGTADQFYQQDPVGPPGDVPVSPWINVVNGTSWTAQGDETGANQQARWWAKTQAAHAVGALGVRTVTSAPSDNTDY